MMHKQIILFILSLLPIILIAQTGKVFDNLSMKSDILEMDRKYAIYLPPDYETSERSYPVLYLLHGGGDDQSGWIQFGEVLHIADNSINEGSATSMIIVMPDANAGRRGYFNSLDGEWRYEDFFFEEFIPFIEGKYRIKTKKRYRAIAGLSMGGGGTFVYALHHPELFAAACPLSANCGPISLEDSSKYSWSWKRGPNGEKLELNPQDKEKILKYRSVLYLMENMPDEQKEMVRWYIDCGDHDELFFDKKNALVHNIMRDKGIPHEYRVKDGGHNWTYWRSALPEVLEFVSQSFHQK